MCRPSFLLAPYCRPCALRTPPLDHTCSSAPPRHHTQALLTYNPPPVHYASSLLLSESLVLSFLESAETEAFVRLIVRPERYCDSTDLEVFIDVHGARWKLRTLLRRGSLAALNRARGMDLSRYVRSDQVNAFTRNPAHRPWCWRRRRWLSAPEMAAFLGVPSWHPVGVELQCLPDAVAGEIIGQAISVHAATAVWLRLRQLMDLPLHFTYGSLCSGIDTFALALQPVRPPLRLPLSSAPPRASPCATCQPPFRRRSAAARSTGSISSPPSAWPPLARPTPPRGAASSLSCATSSRRATRRPSSTPWTC